MPSFRLYSIASRGDTTGPAGIVAIVADAHWPTQPAKNPRAVNMGLSLDWMLPATDVPTAWWSYTNRQWHELAAAFAILVLLAEVLAWLVMQFECVDRHLISLTPVFPSPLDPLHRPAVFGSTPIRKRRGIFWHSSPHPWTTPCPPTGESTPTCWWSAGSRW